MAKSKIRERIRIHHSMLQIFHLKFFACCITAAFATAGCISQPTMKTVGTPLIQSPSSAGPRVTASEVIQIDLKQTYEGMERSLLSMRYVQDWLHYASIPKSMLPPEGDFAHLTITVKGKALSAIYRKVGRRYTGARVHISLRLELHNGVVYHRHYKEKTTPGLSVVGEKYQNPSYAPFQRPVYRAIEKAMPNMLAEVFGCDSLIPAMMDTNSSIRGRAGYTLRTICPNLEISEAARDAVPVFVSTMKDKNRTVKERKWAIQALSAIGPPAHEAIPALIKILQKDRFTELCYSSSLALKNIGPEDPAVLSALIQALYYKSVRVRMNCALLIPHLDPEAVSVVSELIKVLHSNNYARIYAAVSLGEIGSPEAIEAVPDLIRVLGEEWENTKFISRERPKYHVQKALKKITGQDYSRNPEQWQDWWNKMKNQLKGH